MAKRLLCFKHIEYNRLHEHKTTNVDRIFCEYYLTDCKKLKQTTGKCLLGLQSDVTESSAKVGQNGILNF